MRKKVAMTLDQRYIMMIDNAYYSVNPPITEARSQVKSSRIIIITDRFLAPFFRENIGIIFLCLFWQCLEDSRIIWLHYFFICSPMFHVCKKWQNILNDLIFYLKCFFVFFLQGRKLTPIQEYIEKLIFNDLSSHNTEKVLKQIRRLHWNDDPEEAAFVVKTLGSVWNYKFNNIR